jgi:membrane protein YdbS with pleckstrin-like domain
MLRKICFAHILVSLSLSHPPETTKHFTLRFKLPAQLRITGFHGIGHNRVLKTTAKKNNNGKNRKKPHKNRCEYGLKTGNNGWSLHLTHLYFDKAFFYFMGENLIWSGGRSIISLWPWWLMGVLTIWILGLGIIFIIVGAWKAYARKYEVTSERVKATRGLISHSISEAELDKITDVAIEQGAIARILNYGTLYFNTSGGGGYEIIFYNIPEPKALQEKIRAARRKP